MRKVVALATVGALASGIAIATTTGAVAQDDGAQGQDQVTVEGGYQPSTAKPGDQVTLTIKCTGNVSNIKPNADNLKPSDPLTVTKDSGTSPIPNGAQRTFTFTVKSDAKDGEYNGKVTCSRGGQTYAEKAATFTVKSKTNPTSSTKTSAPPTSSTSKPAPPKPTGSVKPGQQGGKPGGGSQIHAKPQGGVNTGGGGTAH